MELNRDQYEKVYDILVKMGGADPNPYTRSSFLYAHLEPPTCKEWRFQGKLGSGGKYWSGGNKVDCYTEDETPKRRRLIKKINEALAKIVTNEQAIEAHNRNAMTGWRLFPPR